MKYHAPYGSSDPDAPYVDRDTPGAIRGSVPPAKAIEDPQRELVSVLVSSGLSPADATNQVAQAIRSQSMNYREAGGTANALTIALDPAPGSWDELVGVPLRCMITTTNTSSTVTFGVAGLTGTKPIKTNVGENPRPRSLTAGAIVEMIFDGAVMRIVSGLGLGGFVGVQSFGVAGSHTYTPSPGVTTVLVHVLGGGGGGGGAAANSNSNYVAAGSGGNAGSYGVGVYTVSGPVTVTVGAGGAGATGGGSSGTQGAAGGASSFGAFLTSPGGTGGQVGGPVSPPFGLAGFSQSPPTGGTVLNAQGQPGGLSLGILAANGGYGGPGGVGAFGGGSQPVGANSPGVNALGPGCGGGGTCVAGVNGALKGGNGTAGLVIVHEYSN